MNKKKFFEKKKIFGKKFSGPRKIGRFRPYLGQKWFFWHAVFCKSSKMIHSNYICNLNKIVRAVFEKSGKNLIFGHFGHFFLAISREPKFSRTCGFLQNVELDVLFRFKPFPDKTNTKFFLKVPKTSFLGYFGPFLPNFGKMGVFPKNRASSLFFTYWPPKHSRKSEKTNGGKYENFCDWQTDWRSWIQKDSGRVLKRRKTSRMEYWTPANIE